ncbi:MAG: hypothetical protein BGO30_06320 [Bacteroidetes bacterium 41-46]|nr:MAG: hypothetical protein BGO30_06320 [Bacteroidetes bacterium 41-46]
MKKTIILLAAALTITTLTIIATAYNFLFSDNVRQDGYLYIYDKSDPVEFLKLADSSGLFIKLSRLQVSAKTEKLSVAEPGRYRIAKGMGSREIVRMVKYGWQAPVNITLSSHIRTKERVASILSRNLRADSVSILKMLKNDSLAKSFGFDNANFIGMFIPNTYELFWTITPEEIAKRFKREYDLFWKGEREQRAERIGLTPQQVVTLASIVSEETNVKAEYPVIAGVYLNRIAKGIPLQADPTVKFAIGDFGLKRILFKHLETSSPYNTYKVNGLPPGPINIPPLQAVDGVLNRAEHKYLYFCASEALDGTHAFSESLGEHNRRARAYHSALNRLNIR